jgi:predicted acyl esterase
VWGPAHHGQPAGTDGGVADIKAWFDHYLLGVDNGIDTQPAVQMLMSDGSRETYDAGQFVRYDASDWPVPGTTWRSLALSPVHSTDHYSINNGSLVDTMPATTTVQRYAAITSVPTQSDVPNAAFFGNAGLNALASLLPQLTQTNLGEPLGLSYTTEPLTQDVLSAGPAALDLRLASTSSQTNLWAVIADVWPDGTSHPVASARLNSRFPNIDAADSITDGSGQVVGPYGDFSAPTTTKFNTERTYQMAFWPIGNEFKAGDRIRLVIFGASPASLLSPPAVNTVRLGGPNGSRLLLPVLPAQP